MKNHFDERHPTHEIPENAMPDEEEIVRVKNMKYKH